MSKYIYPVLSIVLFLALLFLSSLLTSINTLRSSYHMLLWAAYSILFLLSVALPIKFSIQRNALFFAFFLSTLLFIGHSLNSSLFPFLSLSSYQFVLRIAGEHNHLGDLAGLVLSVFLLTPSLFSLLGIALSFIVMVVSFSKSAFLGVLMVSGVLAIQKGGSYRFWFITLFVASCMAISVYTSELSSIPFIHTSQTVMTRMLHLTPKSILSVRDSYYAQVFRAWRQAPLEQQLFGYGPGNYIYPSVQTGRTIGLTPTETHNILLSICIENGLLSCIWFALFCILVVYLGLHSQTLSVYLVIYLLANFQTDFTYAIPFFMGIFFIAAGQSVHEKTLAHTIVRSSSYLLALGVVGVLTLFSATSFYTLQNQKKKLDGQLQMALVQKNKQGVQTAIQQLEKITPFEEVELVRWAIAQEKVGAPQEAIRLFEKLAVYSPRWYLRYLPRLLELQKKEKQDINKYLKSKRKMFVSFPYTADEKEELNNICEEFAEMKCIN